MELANTLGITLSTGLGGLLIAFAAATDVNQHTQRSVGAGQAPISPPRERLAWYRQSERTLTAMTDYL